MPLTITEQLQVLNEGLAPNPPTTETKLKDLVKQTSYVFANTFKDGAKVPANTDLLEFSYKEKMLNLSASILRDNANTVLSLSRQIVVLLAPLVDIDDTAFDNQVGWETFINNHIEEAFEDISGVLTEEKSAYDAF